MISKLLFYSLIVVAISVGTTMAQQDAPSFCTPTPGASSMPLNITDAINQIQDIRIGWDSNGSCTGENILVSRSMHWHIYSLPSDEDNEPRIAMYPPNIVKPELDHNKNVLQFRFRSLDRGDNTTYEFHDAIQAGVALWMPAETMASLQIENLIGDVVSIAYNGTDTLRVGCAGMKNRVMIQSQRAPVFYDASGPESSATILATGASGSRIQMSGFNSFLEISVPSNTTLSDDLLQVTISGTKTKAKIIGDYGSVSVSGLAAEVVVDTSCSGVISSGLDVSCSVNTDVVVTKDDLELSCLADTDVTSVHRRICSLRHPVIEAALGALVGIFVCVIQCISCCYFWRRRCRRHKANNYDKSLGVPKGICGGVEEATPLPTFDGRVVDPEVPVTMASASATIIPVDTHLITAKTGIELGKVDAAGAFS